MLMLIIESVQPLFTCNIHVYFDHLKVGDLINYKDISLNLFSRLFNRILLVLG